MRLRTAVVTDGSADTRAPHSGADVPSTRESGDRLLTAPVPQTTPDATQIEYVHSVEPDQRSLPQAGTATAPRNHLSERLLGCLVTSA